MDTSTHIIMGFGLAGLAYLDPAIASSPELAQAILICTVVGSNAPDFDYGIKLLKGNGMYIEHHRGASHSIPFLFLWTILVSSLTFLFFTEIPYTPLLYWTFIAVILHVSFDLLNTYGTQAGRPFTKKWLSLNFIPLFDPIIVFIHIICFIFWISRYHPGTVFLYGYFMIISYIVIRYILSVRKKKYIMNLMNSQGSCTIIPTLRIQKWDTVFETEHAYYVGTLNKNKLSWIHLFEKHDPYCPYIQASLQDKNVKHFLANAKHTHALFVSHPEGYEVRWVDLRFRLNHHYPYMAIVKLNNDLQITSSYAGWVYQSKKIQKKLATSEKRAV